MKLHAPTLAKCRQKRAEMDRSYRETTLRAGPFYVVRMAYFWAIMREGRRGLLTAVDGPYYIGSVAMREARKLAETE